MSICMHVNTCLLYIGMFETTRVGSTYAREAYSLGRMPAPVTSREGRVGITFTVAAVFRSDKARVRSVDGLSLSLHNVGGQLFGLLFHSLFREYQSSNFTDFKLAHSLLLPFLSFLPDCYS